MISTALCVALVLQAPPEAAGRIAVAHDWAARIGREMGDSVWPGFRPDTIPVIYVLPGRGTLLVGWTGDLPEGYTPVVADPADPNAPPQGIGWHPFADPSAASFATSLGGRNAAQVVVKDSDDIAAIVGTTTHEAFHVFERAARQPGRKFGAGENAFLVTSYPVFDAQNEAGWALEGRILAAALEAGTSADRRALARQFLAARESRQRALGTDYAEFEQLAELNEGLAEYTLVRAVELAARRRDFPDKAGARRLRTTKTAALKKLARDTGLSLRLRFYQTGPALGWLLDALQGSKWKTRLIDGNLTVQDALADASGYRTAEQALRREAEARFAMPALRAAADSDVAGLRARRRAQVDSLLAVPGIELVVSVEGAHLGLCGIDPQNLLQVEPGVLLHTRWVRACAGDLLDASFNTPVVQDEGAQTVTAIVGADSTVKVTPDGRGNVRIESPLVTLQATKAEVTRDGRVVTVKIKT
ncbi:MAG TPA: hypothetical protein VL549_15415 [Gemmatimonadales bacterium]|nr:hypothetical protein [Gemmatimonadales bacterium]